MHKTVLGRKLVPNVKRSKRNEKLSARNEID